MNPTDDDGAAESGAAYVFQLDAQYVQREYVKALNADAGDALGGRVACTSNHLAVGAALEDSDATGVDDPESDDSTSLDSGAGYVLR